MRTFSNQRILSLFIFILLIQISGLYLFKEGFLLTRLELENKSLHTAALANGSKSGIVRFNKTLLVMIDALRYDFMKWDHSARAGEDRPHYKNKLDVLERMQRKKPLNSLLVRGLADPPTTTMQRLVAIMTGALPTLVDAGSNFASSALKEDNLIEKILATGKRVVSLGDDTWDRLFPSSINESYFYPSFDVWDLHR
jgi:phosphatidylinositol glycan class O